MCYYPRYRLPIPEDCNFNPAFKRFGWIENSRAFIWDKRELEKTDRILYHFKKYIDDLQLIPCGQCMECRIKKSKDLAQRALAESLCHEENYFLTLTYDDEHLPIRNCVSRLTGDVGVYSYLEREHLDKFVKDLRRWIDYHCDGSTFMCFPCGEYGSETGRAHFHAILFGIPLAKYGNIEVVKDVHFNGRTYSYLTSPVIEKIWGKGFITLAEVNYETCAYVSRYVTKKMIGRSEDEYQYLCSELGVPPQPREFHGAPKRPGMGLRFYQEHKDEIYKLDEIILPGGKKLQPCEYYDKKYDLDNPEHLKAIKDARKQRAALSNMNKYFGCTGEQVEASEKVHKEVSERRFKRLKRNKI